MLLNAFEPKIRPHAGTRPMALLALAFGVAIGGSLAGAPVRAIDPVALAPIFERPESVPGDLAMVATRPVRVIPLPVRDEPSVFVR